MQIRKTFKAETAHRVADAYTTRCRGLHGHSYEFEIILKDTNLNNCGMVLDFKLVKEKINALLDAFDHSLLIWDKDEFLVKNAKELNERYMIVPYNPTAELMALHIYKHIKKMYDVESVIVHETRTGYAKYSGEDINKDIDLDKVFISEAILNEI